MKAEEIRAKHTKKYSDNRGDWEEINWASYALELESLIQQREEAEKEAMEYAVRNDLSVGIKFSLEDCEKDVFIQGEEHIQRIVKKLYEDYKSKQG